MLLEDLGELQAGELAPPCLRWGRLWSVLNTSVFPRASASLSRAEGYQDSPPKIVGMAFVGLQQVWGVNRGVDRTLRGVFERIGNG